MTVRENGVVALELPTVSWSPAGELAKVNETVRGSSRRVTVCVCPPESVAVRRSSRCAGYS